MLHFDAHLSVAAARNTEANRTGLRFPLDNANESLRIDIVDNVLAEIFAFYQQVLAVLQTMSLSVSPEEMATLFKNTNLHLQSPFFDQIIFAFVKRLDVLVMFLLLFDGFLF